MMTKEIKQKVDDDDFIQMFLKVLNEATQLRIKNLYTPKIIIFDIYCI